ncbi:MAG: hypothetical protein ACE5E6_04435, partial [Phycisphaerae bacterium]
MKPLVLHPVGAFCVITMAGACALGDARLFMLPVGVPPKASTPGTAYQITAQPGDVITYDAWLENTAPQNVKTWEVYMFCCYEADAGEVAIVSDAVDDERCDYIFPLFQLCPPPTVGHLPVTEHQGVCPPKGSYDNPHTVNIATPNPVLGETYPVVTDARYLSTWTYEVSADAQGVFRLDPFLIIPGFPRLEFTHFLDSDDMTIPFSVDPLEIVVGMDPLTILWSDPPDGAIDARQPSEPDGSNPAGWDAIVLTFDGDATGMTPDDFLIEQDPPGDPPVPDIAGVAVDGDAVTLALTGSINVARWTRFTHAASGTSVRIGYLPADVNNDRLSNAND